ncbi:hypothetical protein OGAPHI_007080 [Ogataea philodendri]|uniref:SEC7 domain-containing protein n=1 Tax=Ogataea philodendri TaxID=1378263 RepID=A0A9P8NWS3_9ASCO|nr:uncharacterized protein OGAPHI_007080 [Ogataea philodendri]KAH3660494.1 hypothetical protein OGAPHI_007080 [Ogataea philodendri]
MNSVRLSTIDPLSFAIGECTFISSVMRKSSKSSVTGPLSALLGSQFTKENSPYVDEDNGTRLSTFLRSGTKVKDDDHFLSGFIELRSILSELKSIDDIDVLTLLQPFLLVIRSPSTSGYITDVAVTSLSKFIKYGIVNEGCTNILQCLGQIVSALSRCRFEGTDQTQDDILLIKIIQLLEVIVSSKLGDLLTDDSMYETVSTCFSLAINTRRREILRSAAETSLIGITEKIFSKLRHIPVDEGVDHNVKTLEVELTATTESGGLPTDTIGGTDYEDDVNHESKGESDLSNSPENRDESPSTPEAKEDDVSVHVEEQVEEAQEVAGTNVSSLSEDEQVPFGLPCMKEYMNHTIDILSPENQFRFTESSRILALNILNTIIEVSGGIIAKHSALLQLISDKTCHHLVQLIQTADSPYLLTLAMKLFLNLTLNMNEHLKIQIELLLTTIFQDIVANQDMLLKDLEKNQERVFKMGEKGSFEVEQLSEKEVEELGGEFQTGKFPIIKEILVETLSVLWIRSPLFFNSLFKSYDCDFDRSDIAEMTLRLLCRLSSSEVTLFTTGNVPSICMEGVLSFVDGVHDRVKEASKLNIEFSGLSPNQLVLQQIKKSDFIECTKKWNEKPQSGLDLLQEKGFIKDISDVSEVARFLFEKSGRIDKKKLGELLAKPSNKELLKEFIDLLDFKNLRPDEALRMLLNNFRLPGEAQQIERIVEVFNHRYISCQDADSVAENGEEDEDQKVTPDQDSLFVLSFSIIMLNTDLHNPNVKKPMTLEDYQRNLRGCYKGKDFPQWYTEKIYHSIREKEIIMPEEHRGTSKWFETVWHSLIAEQSSKLLSEEVSSLAYEKLEDSLQFDQVLFEKISKDVISTLVMMFDDATHDSVVTRMISSVEKCASIASYFGMNELVDEIIEIVAHLTTLTGVKESEFALDSREALPITELKLEKENETITVSYLSVSFGRDFRAQLSTLVLFRIVRKSNYRVSKHWVPLVKIILTLFENGLIEPDLFPEFQKRIGLDGLEKPKPQYQFSRTKALKDNGIFSTFSSYLKGLSDDTPEPTDEEIECTLSTMECIKSSSINSLFRNVSKTDSENLNQFVSILLESIPSKEDADPRVYLNEILFILEICVCYLLLTGEQELVIKTLTLCDKVFSPAEDFKMSCLVRVNAYKLLLLHNGNKSNADLLNSTIEKFLTLAEKNREALMKYGSVILHPLQMLVLVKGTWCQIILSQNSKYWSLIRIFAASPKNTEIVYQFMRSLIETLPEIITYQNYMDVLGLLDEISAVGAYGAQWEQEYDKLIASGHKVEKNKNPFQDLVATASKSISLTLSLSKIVESEQFKETIPNNSETPSSWYPLIEAIAHQCYNPCRELRSHALKTLTTLLVSSDLPLDSLSPELVLDAGCIRLLLELLKPEVESTDVNGMVKTQHDVLNLACKVILIYKFNDVTSTVGKLLTLSSKFLARNRHRENFKDEALEFLKNMLLVKRTELKFDELNKLKLEPVLKQLLKDVEAGDDVKENLDDQKKEVEEKKEDHKESEPVARSDDAKNTSVDEVD